MFSCGGGYPAGAVLGGGGGGSQHDCSVETQLRNGNMVYEHLFKKGRIRSKYG